MSETKKALREAEFLAIQNSLNAVPEERIRWFDDFNYREEPAMPAQNPFWFLSNFYVGEPIKIPFMGELTAPTGEHLFHAFKAQTVEDFFAILDSPSPDEAKHRGRTVKMDVERWNAVCYDAMAFTLRAKFAVGRKESQLLLDTGDAYLEEGTWWDDQKWGVALDLPGCPGRNWLGTLLMARRAELRSGVANVYLIRETQQRSALAILAAGMPFLTNQ
jgi:ribA/ribD-fused uncharacterized protein